MTEGITPDINEWTHPRTGQVRRYINNWAEVAGIEVDRYRSGSLRSAYIAPCPLLDDVEGGISNRQAARMLDGKAWLDPSDRLHLDRQYGCNDITRDQLRARIIHGLRCGGIEAH